MGMKIKQYDKFVNKVAERQAYTTDKLSTSVVNVIDKLCEDEEIFKLLYFEDDKSLIYDLDNDEEAKDVFEKRLIGKHNSKHQRIKAYPFNTHAQESHEAFIRVYYNQGSKQKGGFMGTNQMNIDIIVSHGLWLTSDPEKKLKLIRAYALMARINDILVSEKIDKLPTPSGYTHLTVNDNFECIRIYANNIATDKENIVSGN